MSFVPTFVYQKGIISMLVLTLDESTEQSICFDDCLRGMVATINEAYVFEGHFKADPRRIVNGIDQLKHEISQEGVFTVLYQDEMDGFNTGELPEVVDLSKIVGLVKTRRLDEQRLYLGMLTVSVNQQGKGYGKYLLENVTKLAKEGNYTIIELLVINLNPHLLTAYSKLKYIIIDMFWWGDMYSTDILKPELREKNKVLFIKMQKSLVN